MVSVCMITYNHEDFIGQAIEGVLMQKSNFNIELIIGEDASTDKTAAIVSKYVQDYPDLIKVRYNKYNLGMMTNAINTLKECRGKYIAICEGDDYWTSPLKLGEQVNFLEANEDYAMCFTRYNVVDSSGNVLQKNIGYSKDLSHEGVFSKRCPPTPTVLFRTDSLNRCLDSKIWNELYYPDHALFGFITKDGKAKSLNINSVNYRIHKGGVWSQDGFDKRLFKSQSNLEIMKKYFNESGELYAIEKGILNIKKKLLHFYLYNKRIRDFFELSYQIIEEYKLKGFYHLFIIYLYLLKKMVKKSYKILQGVVFMRS